MIVDTTLKSAEIWKKTSRIWWEGAIARQDNNNHNNQQHNNPNNKISSTQAQLRIEQKAPETIRDAEMRNKEQKNQTLWVISGGPIHGGTISSGLDKSLEKHHHLVNCHSIRSWLTPPVMSEVSFSTKDCRGIIYRHDDPLVLARVRSRKMPGEKNTGRRRKLSQHNLLGGFYPTANRWERGHTGELAGDRVFRSHGVPEGSIRLPIRIGKDNATSGFDGRLPGDKGVGCIQRYRGQALHPRRAGGSVHLSTNNDIHVELRHRWNS